MKCKNCGYPIRTNVKGYETCDRCFAFYVTKFMDLGYMRCSKLTIFVDNHLTNYKLEELNEEVVDKELALHALG